MKRNLLTILAVLILVSGCKESPEQAAKRIRDTMVAMQSQQAAAEKANSEAVFDLLSKHATAIKKGDAIEPIRKTLGDPLQVRPLATGDTAEAWSGAKGNSQTTLVLVVADGNVKDITASTKP